jgi:hypothetical protein
MKINHTMDILNSIHFDSFTILLLCSLGSFIVLSPRYCIASQASIILRLATPLTDLERMNMNVTLTLQSYNISASEAQKLQAIEMQRKLWQRNESAGGELMMHLKIQLMHIQNSMFSRKNHDVAFPGLDNEFISNLMSLKSLLRPHCQHELLVHSPTTKPM